MNIMRVQSMTFSQYIGWVFKSPWITCRWLCQIIFTIAFVSKRQGCLRRLFLWLKYWLRSLQGCLQDIHWASGAMGYFPTYTLGAMYAAQLYYAALKALPDLEENVKEGNFTPVREWLREKVHRLGSLPASVSCPCPTPKLPFGLTPLHSFTAW